MPACSASPIGDKRLALPRPPMLFLWKILNSQNILAPIAVRRIKRGPTWNQKLRLHPDHNLSALHKRIRVWRRTAQSCRAFCFQRGGAEPPNSQDLECIGLAFKGIGEANPFLRQGRSLPMFILDNGMQCKNGLRPYFPRPALDPCEDMTNPARPRLLM